VPKLAVVPELEEELDRLYGLPLDEFTAARNELATRMKQAGQNAIATRIRELRKPSVAVWTVNQLARRHPDEVRALVEAGERLRTAQEAALKGEGADAVRAAQRDERDVTRRLTRHAEKLLGEEGRPASPQTLERVNATLRTAAVDPEAAELLAAGRLAEEPESPGFAALASIAPKGTRTVKPRTDDRAKRKPNAQQRKPPQRVNARRWRAARRVPLRKRWKTNSDAKWPAPTT
jgi:hypothetical protein